MSGTCEGLHCSLLALGNPKASLGFRTLSNQLPFFHPFPESLPFSILFPNLPERQRDFTSPFSQLLCLPVYAPVLSLCHSWTVIIWGFLERIKGSMSLNWPLCPLDRVVFKEDQECINSFLFSLSFRHCFFFYFLLKIVFFN